MSGEFLSPVAALLNLENPSIDQINNVSLAHNPLHCLLCQNQLNEPVSLPCHHVFCKSCITKIAEHVANGQKLSKNPTVSPNSPSNSAETGQARCPLCGKEIAELKSKINKIDNLVKYLVDSSQEQSDLCANCDQINQPMYFCETCNQPLCNNCKDVTHQAKMFSAHKIVPLEERTNLHARKVCPKHSEPLILFASEQKTLVCVKCFRNAAPENRPNYLDLEIAHKIGCEKLEKQVFKLKNFQQEVKDTILLHKKLLEELTESSNSQTALVQQTCQEMVDSILQVRDKLLTNLRDDRSLRKAHFKQNLRQLGTLLPSTQLYLLSASIFCSSATSLDFLQYAYDLMKRIGGLIADHPSLQPEYTGLLEVNCREEFAHVLEPYLGLTSFLLPTVYPDLNTDPLMNYSLTPKSGNSSPGSAVSSYRRWKRSGGGASYVNCPNGGMMSRYQLIVDLAGAFGEEFAKVETPLKQFSAEMTYLGKEAQELQRDMTLRRRLVERKRVDGLVDRTKVLESKVVAHSALVGEVQSSVQQIWQEQLDRVRRQQMMLRTQVETSIRLKEDLRQIVRATSQLQPFIQSIASAVQVANPKRCHPPDPAPMEQICNQIQKMEPNSQSRVDAIEQEEKKRKAAMEQRRKDYGDTLVTLKKQLKTPKDHSTRKRLSAGAAGSSGVTVVGRDRSRGGRDPAMLSPNSGGSKRSSWAGMPRGSLSPRLEGGSPSLTDQSSSLDESFEQLETSLNTPHHVLQKSARAHTVAITKALNFSEVKREARSESLDLKTLSISLPDTENWVQRAADTMATQSGAGMGNEHQRNVEVVRETRSESNPEPRDLEKEPPPPAPKIVLSPKKLTESYNSVADCDTKSSIPKPPRLPPNLVNTVEQSTLDAREKVLASLKERVPRVEIGCSNSPVRELEEQKTTEEEIQVEFFQ